MKFLKIKLIIKTKTPIKYKIFPIENNTLQTVINILINITAQNINKIVKIIKIIYKKKTINKKKIKEIYKKTKNIYIENCKLLYTKNTTLLYSNITQLMNITEEKYKLLLPKKYRKNFIFNLCKKIDQKDDRIIEKQIIDILKGHITIIKIIIEDNLISKENYINNGYKLK